MPTPKSIWRLVIKHPKIRLTHSPAWPLSLDLLAILFISIGLIIPDRLAWITPRSLLFFPLELLILGFVLMLPGFWGRLLTAVATQVLAVGILLKLASVGSYEIFARPFNPVLDAYLLVNALDLLHKTLGALGALMTLAALLGGVVAVFLLSCWAIARTRQLVQQRRRAAGGAIACATVAVCAMALAPWHLTTSNFSAQLALRFNHARASLADLHRFAQELDRRDAPITEQHAGLLERLQGKDVLLVFVESYGRTLLANPEFEAHIRPLLRASEADLAAAGFAARSGFLTSPTVGGISWLAHGTLLSGLWIDSQIRYDSLILSQRPTLNHLFRASGWRTVAVMPAITMAWPEGGYFGYDQIYAADDLGYRGLPFNWVTMPDQYTLSAFQTRERAPVTRGPVMAEIALISSHAPWTPVPTLIDWREVGDGRIFDAQASAGEAPEVVWQDSQRVRLQYRKSIEYALQSLVSYITTFGDDDLVVLVLGDHQPAPLVTGPTDNRDVPVHMIARDPTLLDAIDAWQWSRGMLPDDSAPVWRMDKLRGRFVEAFSRPASERLDGAEIAGEIGSANGGAKAKVAPLLLQ